MYTKDKNHRITLRLNEDQFNFVRSNAETIDCSPSDFLRMVINASMVADRKIQEKLAAKVQAKEGLGRENDEADCHNQL